MATEAPYGSWESPITAEQAAAVSGQTHWTGFVDDYVCWVEPRPAEGGRSAIMRSTPDGPEELLPAPWNARNRVHEYGGNPWAYTDGVLAFTNWDDQRVYALKGTLGATSGPEGLHKGTPEPLTPVPERHHGVRYSDLVAGRPGEVWAVRETVTGDAPTDVVRDLVAISVAGGVRPLGSSHHFMTAPRISPDGTKAAWIGWEHPDMPWDASQLVVADIDGSGMFGPHRVVAGGPGVSVCQVEWETDDALLALIDPDGWWNLHRVLLDGTSDCLLRAEEEIGGPLWMLGARWFAPLGENRHAVLRGRRLAVLDASGRTLTDVPAAAELPVWGTAIAARDGVVVGVAAGPKATATVTAADLQLDELRTLSVPTVELPPAEYLPEPQARTFTGPDGDIPAYVYPPTNPDFVAPQSELPPYIVHVHGGPTGAVDTVADLHRAYLTSRGIGVVAVNYGGSAGYGRRFRERLRHQWGVVDVADCETVAKALAAEGTADPRRLGIRGGSAGGYTSALSSVTTKTYAAANVMFPVIDLLAFAEGGTHDFESQYDRGLVGRLPEDRQRYIDRSPITHVATLACPVLLLQGLEDEVCLPAQAEAFVAAIRGKGIPHKYVPFEGEQHGFRRAESIIAALQSEVAFYGQVFGFTPPGVPPLELDT